jgi:hypothetical protein
MTHIEDEFSPKGIYRGGILFLRPHDAIDMVNRCRQLGTRVLGIDGFVLSENATQPDLANSADYSYINEITLSWDQAEEFLKQRLDSGMFFEVVTE